MSDLSEFVKLVSEEKKKKEVELENKIKNPHNINGVTIKISLKLLLATDPSNQLIISAKENGLGARFNNRDIKAAEKLERPTPIKINVTTELTLIATTTRNPVATKAPTIE